MKIGFISNYQNGYVGEISDSVHITREIETLEHQVFRILQDEWREYVIENSPKGKYKNVPENIIFDIFLITKWHHFYDGSFISKAREKYKCPVFLWVWDYMQGEDWHMEAVKACDLYLGNDVRSPYYEGLKNCYYFPFDVADRNLPWMQVREADKKYDVVFFGSCLEQGDRIEYLRAINKTTPVKIFAWNYQEWINLGFDAEPARYGLDFVQTVGESRIILGFSVEPSCWGYWSNRVGKVLSRGGFLLYQYAPGMELFLRDGCEYFSSIEEAQEKIDHYLIAVEERQSIAKRGRDIGRERFTSEARVKDLMILCERYLKTGGKGWNF